MTIPPRTIAVMCALTVPLLCRAGTGTVAARARDVASRFTGYAEVVSGSRITLRAAATGVITGLHVLPGDEVDGDTVLARLAGPTVDASLTRREADVDAARGALAAARKTLAADRQKRAEHLGTRSAVYRAQATMDQARARFDTARAELKAMRAATAVSCPEDARVMSVSVSNGDRVAKGQALMALRGGGESWLKASFYGTDAGNVHRGQRGTFSFADRDGEVRVRVRGVAGILEPDGGMVVTLVATHADPGWQVGEPGTVTLSGGKRHVVTVPTRALILDRGRWWVLVDGPEGQEPHRVVPGDTVGEATIISRGVTAGERVVVTDAYLRYHRHFSARYAQPD